MWCTESTVSVILAVRVNSNTKTWKETQLQDEWRRAKFDWGALIKAVACDTHCWRPGKATRGEVRNNLTNVYEAGVLWYCQIAEDGALVGREGLLVSAGFCC